MDFWLPALLLTGMSALVLFAGARGKTGGHLSETNQASLAIYKDQLSEIERDLAIGVLPANEAEGQRVEVARRMLAASRQIETISLAAPPRLMLLGMAVALSIVAIPIYLKLGQPGFADVPRASRMAQAQERSDLPAMIAQVEEHLLQKPNDLSGWRLLIPNYMSLERYSDAANAMAQVIRLTKPNAELYANFAEALTLGNKGLMSPQALLAIAQALNLDANNPKARFYNNLGLAQAGKKSQAIAGLRAMLASAAPNAPWQQMVKEEIARIEGSGAAPQISQQQVADAKTMTADDQNAMIRGMVDGLEEKLKSDTNNLEGWLRVIRARTVLNEKAKASIALATATTIFKEDAKALKLLTGLAEELKLQ